jgi:G3E family GTPase
MIQPNSPSENDATPSAPARYIMMGGFLGAGKTTAVAILARHLSERGLRVGLITNDQGQNLVDTAMLRARGFATEEIPGGCFCCRFNSLVDASAALIRTARPQVFIAEPVGSCTDLVATVSYPLRRLYGNNFVVAPLSVLVDPIRARRIFGLERGGNFSDKVLYIYRKQLEEAGLIVVSKADLVSPEKLEDLRLALTAQYPRAEVLVVSARTGMNLEGWFTRLMDFEQPTRATMEIDYNTYADGEALLGWLNGTVQLAARQPFDANRFLNGLAVAIQNELRVKRVEIAHLKMTLSPEGGLGEIAVVNLVRSDFVPELSIQLEEAVTRAQLILNLRAEAPPDLLNAAVRKALQDAMADFPTLRGSLDHLEHFQPGRPNPTHRDQVAAT